MLLVIGLGRCLGNDFGAPFLGIFYNPPDLVLGLAGIPLQDFDPFGFTGLPGPVGYLLGQGLRLQYGALGELEQ